MANQQVGWSTKEKLLRDISKKLDQLIKVISKINNPSE